MKDINDKQIEKYREQLLLMMKNCMLQMRK